MNISGIFQSVSRQKIQLILIIETRKAISTEGDFTVEFTRTFDYERILMAIPYF